MNSVTSACSFFKIIAVTLVVAPVMSLNAALAESAAPAGINYDIPISELNKVKKRPVHQPSSETGKKKKSTAKSRKATSHETRHTEKSKESRNVAAGEKVQNASPVAEQSGVSGEFQILHSPYSFVVAGKSTIIQAVISSKTDIREVNCALSIADGVAPTLIKMEKVNGTRFTYSATLPGLPAEAPSLRYTIAAVNSQGVVVQSQEFVTPSSASPVVPSWQLENSTEAAPAKQKEETKTQSVSPEPAPAQ